MASSGAGRRRVDPHADASGGPEDAALQRSWSMNAFSTWGRAICWLLLLAAAAEFVWRGLLRDVVTDDFAAPYASARAWTMGQDPYDSDSLLVLLKEAGGHDLTVPVYPPGTFLLLSPLAQLPFPLARQVWLVLATALLGLATAALLSLARLSWRSPAGLALIAVVLALAPCHTGLAHRQPAMAAAGLLVFSSWQICRGSLRGGGVSLGLAMLLKPQLAGPLLLYHTLRRRWSPVGLALGISAVATALAVGWLWVNQVDWLGTWRENVRREAAVGGNADPQGPVRYGMIDLRPLVHAVVGEAGTANALVLAIAVATGVVSIILVRRGPGAADELLGQSCLVVWGLLAFYHRFYDAVLLCYPAAWAIQACRTGPRGLAWMVLAIGLCFLVPGAVILQRLQEQHLLLPALTETGVWTALVAPHEIWALGGMLLCLWSALGLPPDARYPDAAPARHWNQARSSSRCATLNQ
jgi:hypothetical protein